MHLLCSFDFLSLGWELLEKQKVGNLPPIWRCSSSVFFLHLPILFMFSGPQTHLSSVFSCILWEKWNGVVYFMLTYSVFQVKSSDMFSM